MSKMLIVVDMQNDFVSGSLGSEAAKAIVPKVVEKIKNYKGQVLYTKDTHDEDYLETQEGQKLPIKHCVEGTKGWELVPEIDALVKAENSMVFTKEAFASMNLAGCLNGIQKVSKIDELELVGLCTDVCVISNAFLLKGILPETVIKVDANCCAGVSQEGHENALKAMEACQIEIIR